MSETFAEQVRDGQRFEFGKNWKAFLNTLNDDRIAIAEADLKEMLGIQHLRGKTFLDIGCGSGLFSLVAKRLGATVYSFDFDPDSVACTTELRARYYPNDIAWIVEEGSALDPAYLEQLGQFDVVYSWGVLHHTGDMWQAIDNASKLVDDDGTLFIGLYTDRGRLSRFWWRVKKLYCANVVGKAVVSAVFVPYFFGRALFSSIAKRQNTFAAYKKNRGMSITHDWFDWLGGFPFEVASVENTFHFLGEREFALQNIKTEHGAAGGINQYVFTRRASDS